MNKGRTEDTFFTVLWEQPSVTAPLNEVTIFKHLKNDYEYKTLTQKE